MISNRKIDNIGKLLKQEERLPTQEFQKLLHWRNDFSSILNYYYHKLKSDIPENDIIILAKRLKRIESIQIKLKRFKTMRLSTLQDIAGIRIVLNEQTALMGAYGTLRSLTSRNTLKRLDDYHSNPKNDGYRGIHLVYQNHKSQMIEIQLRTKLQHIWATAVEIYGELQETSFKTGEGDEKWREFFLLLSSYFAIKENATPPNKYKTHSKKQILSLLKKSIKKLNVIEKLNASTNGVKIIVSKFNQTGRMGKYAILELNLKNKTTTVEIFNKKDVPKAIELYTQRELSIQDHEKKNIVFVNIESLEKIQKSYPNYFLDTQKLLEILSKIILGEY